ncbi:hypothetical protein [Geothrix edaphica]|uniref:hypothetical protein n=1 Tax=Geothrix edaphica TaxID=2927976 RepID=UPI0025527EC1|nr:hypothetical protein [Geothrix edaphica]
MITNLPTYLAIAEEAFAESERLEIGARTPREDGQPGFVIKYDPERRSFKQSLVAIAFYGMYLDALLFIVGGERLGKAEYKKLDRKKVPYKDRLIALGITDPSLLTLAQHFRDARNDMVHDEAFEITEIQGKPVHTAQKIAREGSEIVTQIAKILQSAP